MKIKNILSLVLLLTHGFVMAQTESRTVMNPQMVTELPDEVKETSGLAFHNGRLYTHNDSGNEPIIYVIDTATYQIIQRITLKDAKNHDWEDICCDDTNMYVGDFGNNKGNRTNLKIYIVPLAAIPESGDAEIKPQKIKFYLADQTTFEYKKHQHDYDCESIMATDKYLYIFSKGWLTGTSRIYRLNKKAGEQVAQVVNWFNPQGLVTGADYDKENRRIVLIGYVKNVWDPFIYIINNFDEDNVSAEKGIRITLPNHIGYQTEGICRYAENKYFISSEKTKVFNAALFKVDLGRAVSFKL